MILASYAAFLVDVELNCRFILSAAMIGLSHKPMNVLRI